jgi:hypothetical protein
VDGARCDLVTERCVRDTPPSVDALAVYRLGPGWYRAVIDGTDAEGGIVQAEVTFVSAAGRDLFWDPDDGHHEGGMDLAQPLLWPELSAGRFTVGADLYFYDDFRELDTTPAGATGFRIEVVDAAGNQSPSRIANWTDLPVRADGATCDPLGLRDVCGPASVCSPTSSRCRSTAVADTERCGAGIATLRSGTSTQIELVGMYSVSNGDCGGSAGPDTVFRLVVGSRSRVTITTDLPGTESFADTVIYLRTTCSDASTEIACDDDSGTGAFAELTIAELPAGTYFVVVDSERIYSAVEVRATVTPL